jgi:hypothetical protein
MVTTSFSERVASISARFNLRRATQFPAPRLGRRVRDRTVIANRARQEPQSMHRLAQALDQPGCSAPGRTTCHHASGRRLTRVEQGLDARFTSDLDRGQRSCPGARSGGRRPPEGALLAGGAAWRAKPPDPAAQGRALRDHAVLLDNPHDLPLSPVRGNLAAERPEIVGPSLARKAVTSERRRGACGTGVVTRPGIR